MAQQTDSPRPKAGAADNGIAPGATVIEGVAHNAKPCRIVDNTGTVDRQELQEVLDALIREKRFGRRGLSGAGDNRIAIDEPQVGHIQFGDTLYRILVFPYEARIEAF